VFLQFQCCGYNAVDDWFNSSFFNTTSRLPDSCNCTNTTVNCMDLPAIFNQSVYERNCSSSVRVFLEANLIVVGAVGITFGVIEVILEQILLLIPLIFQCLY